MDTPESVAYWKMIDEAAARVAEICRRVARREVQVRQVRLLAALGLALSLAGCAKDTALLTVIDQQIATMTSASLVEGPRSASQSQRLAADGLSLRANVHKATGQ